MAVLDPFEGLTWVKIFTNTEPRWTIEPKIENIKQTLRLFQQANSTEISLRAKEGLNMEYDVKIDDESLIMRVAAPADPRNRTLSEVATLDWVHRNTTLPVPRVIAYQATREDPVGFEWILTTKIPGKPLGEVWRYVSFDAKVKIFQEIARFCASSFKNQLKAIGNIYDIPSAAQNQETTENQPQTADQTGSPLTVAAPQVGRIVSLEFLWGSRIHQDVPRGPFTSSKDWIHARLTIIECECHEILAKYPGGGNNGDERIEIDNATRALDIINKLKPLIPIVFPSIDQEPESTMIFPNDLLIGNILVNDSGVLTGVTGWECVSALPLWKGCSIPYFSGRNPRNSEPDISRYILPATREPSGQYWEDLKEFELTTLRRKFLEEMRLQEPAWVDVYENSQVQRDFYNVIEYCDGAYGGDEDTPSHVKEWINDVLFGVDNIRSLDERLNED